MRRRLLAGACASLCMIALLAAGAAPGAVVAPAPRATVAAVQVALHASGAYRGPIDGVAGPLTRRAVQAVQRARGSKPTGRIDAATLRLLGPLGRPLPGSRVVQQGMLGLDVSVLQFELRERRYPAPASGVFDATTRDAVLRFQRKARLRADGLAGAATWAALAPRRRAAHAAQTAPPVPRLRPPLAVKTRPVTTPTGVELFCPYGSAVAAARAGQVVYAGNRGHGYGYTVVIRDGPVQLLYGHLARIDVRRGRRLIAGAMIGLAGWTGKAVASTSLLLELREDGRRLDPLAALRLGAAATP